jgi:hypothetical protein
MHKEKKRKKRCSGSLSYVFFVHPRIKDFKFIIESMRLRVSSTKIDTKNVINITCLQLLTCVNN